MAERKSGRYNEPRTRTKEFFLKNSRSAQLREISLSIVYQLDALLHDPEVNRSDAYSQLEALNGQLIELGIRPGMQTGLPQNVYKRNPVVVAEYVAGQLIKETSVKVVSEDQARPIIQEFSEFKADDNTHIISNPKDLPSPVLDFIVMRSIVNAGYHFLAADADETAPFRKRQRKDPEVE